MFGRLRVLAKLNAGVGNGCEGLNALGHFYYVIQRIERRIHYPFGICMLLVVR